MLGGEIESGTTTSGPSTSSSTRSIDKSGEKSAKEIDSKISKKIDPAAEPFTKELDNNSSDKESLSEVGFYMPDDNNPKVSEDVAEKYSPTLKLKATDKSPQSNASSESDKSIHSKVIVESVVKVVEKVAGNIKAADNSDIKSHKDIPEASKNDTKAVHVSSELVKKSTSKSEKRSSKDNRNKELDQQKRSESANRRQYGSEEGAISSSSGECSTDDDRDSRDGRSGRSGRDKYNSDDERYVQSKRSAVEKEESRERVDKRDRRGRDANDTREERSSYDKRDSRDEHSGRYYHSSRDGREARSTRAKRYSNDECSSEDEYYSRKREHNDRHKRGVDNSKRRRDEREERRRREEQDLKKRREERKRRHEENEKIELEKKTMKRVDNLKEDTSKTLSVSKTSGSSSEPKTSSESKTSDEAKTSSETKASSESKTSSDPNASSESKTSSEPKASSAPKTNDKDKDKSQKQKVSSENKKKINEEDNETVTDPKAKITDKECGTVQLLTSRTGGAYIPPAKLRLMQAAITDKSSAAYQRIAWEALKKSIHGYINKVNVDNISIITREMLRENIVRGRGLLCRSVIQAQAASPTFTHVYAALVAIINSKFPNIGELLLKRLIIQFKRAFRRSDKIICMSSCRFIAHLVNQRVAHEILPLEILTLLIESPTDDSIEVAIAFLKECGMKINEMSSKGISAIFEMLKNILHEGTLEKRVQYMIEVAFQVRKDGFKDHPTVIEELELVEEEDQYTHVMVLDPGAGEQYDTEDLLNVFKFDDQYESNENKYQELCHEILGSESSNSDSSSSGSGSSSDGSSTEDEDGNDEKKKRIHIIDNTETNLIALRRTIYLTINSSLDYEECAHKLIKMQLKPGQEIELCHMFIDCCAEQRTYEKFYGLLSQRFCAINKMYIHPFEKIFKDTYDTTHRLDTNRLRNVSKFFAHLLYTNAIGWDVLECIKLNEDETTSSNRIFIKILFQELAEYMGLSKLNSKLKHPDLRDIISGIFPKDNPRNSRFSINFFTSIGLGGLTDELRQFLRNAPRSLPGINSEILLGKPPVPSSSSTTSSSSSSSSTTSSSSTSTSSDSSDSSSDSSDSEDAHKKRRKGKKKRPSKITKKKQLKKKYSKEKDLKIKAQKKSKAKKVSTEHDSNSESDSSSDSSVSKSGADKKKRNKHNKRNKRKKSRPSKTHLAKYKKRARKS